MKLPKISPVSFVLFAMAFAIGVVFVDRSAQAQGVAAAVSLWLNGSYVSASNPLPVHNQ